MWNRGTSILRAFLPVACALALSACKTESKRSTGAQACEDMADAVAKAAVRCSQGTYTDSFNAFVQGAALGDCNNIVQIRDKEALYKACIPSFQTINCLDFSNANQDASCRQQLVRR